MAADLGAGNVIVKIVVSRIPSREVRAERNPAIDHLAIGRVYHFGRAAGWIAEQGVTIMGAHRTRAAALVNPATGSQSRYLRGRIAGPTGRCNWQNSEKGK